MKQLYSGLDAWLAVIEAESQKDTFASYLPLILSAAGALGVLPFTVLRFMQGHWFAAAIDSLIVFGFVALGLYVYKTRQVRFASIALSFFCVAGVVSTVYGIGPQQVFWTYPALMAIFYLVRPREAILFALVIVIALIPALMQTKNTEQVSTVIITLVVMSSFAFAFSLIANRQNEQLVQLATRDPLTGAGNRRHLESKLLEVIHSYDRRGTVASLLLIDLDHFKTVNDIHGHAAGDQILKRITEIFNLRIRVTDSIYRIGGEEFVVVLEGQDLERAAHLAEQLRLLVETNELVPDHSVTISIGVAELKMSENGNEWIHRADAALYSAKHGGRNATHIAD